MDRKLLDSFNNLSIALQALSDSLNDNKKDKQASESSISDALKSLDITEQLKSINDGVKEIQKDNVEIIKNQKNILSKISQKSQKSEIENSGDPKQQKGIKDGVKMILLIAGGVLAIGMAFKLIGKVDFPSVIALSLAMPLIAFAFEKVSKSKMSLKDVLVSTLSLVAASVAIAASSHILQYVKPVGAMQLLTVVFIAGAFAALSFSISKLAAGVKGVDTKSLWKLPLVLIAASVAIAGSSYILQYVKPVGFMQLITIVLISAAFSVISLGLGKLTKSVSGINLKDVATLPLVMIGVSTAIMVSSFLLSKVSTITFGQALTSIAIAAVFTVVSYGLPKIASSIKGVDIKTAAMMPIILVELAAAIMLSSYILSKVQEIPAMTLLNIALQSITLSVIGIAMGGAIWALDKMKITTTKAIEGGLSLVIIATSIMATSWILSIGNYSDYPSLDWTLGAGASMLAMGAMVVGLGLLATTGYGAAAILLGAIALPIVALSVAATSGILASGSYEKYPPLEWSGSVSLSMISFSVAMASTGLLIGPLLLGMITVPLIAKSIVKVADIFSGAKFTGGPSLSWAIGTGSLLAAFGGSMVFLGSFIIGSLGVGYAALKLGAKGIKLIAQSIVDSSEILGKGRYIGGPTKEWAEGVSLAIGAFAPVYRTLTSKGILSILSGGKGSSPEKMRDAITTISDGIVTAALHFSKNKVAFENGPPEDWAKGTGAAISAFSPVLKNLHSFGIFDIFTGSAATPESMVDAIETISYGVISAAEIFNGNKTGFNGVYPSVEWGEGVGSAIAAFAPVFEKLGRSGGLWGLLAGDGPDADEMSDTITSIARSIVSVANILSGNYDGSGGVPNFNTIIPETYTDSLSKNYSSFFGILEKYHKGRFKASNIGDIQDVTKAIAFNSIILSMGNYKPIPTDYMSSLSNNIMAYMNLIEHLKGNVSDAKTFFGITISNRTSDITKMADDYDKLSNSIKKLSTSIQSINIEKMSALKTLTGSIVLMSLMDSNQFGDMMDKLEEKTKIFVDVIKEIEGSTTGKELSVNVSSAKKSGPTIQDIINIMSRMDARLSQISSNSSNISQKISEIKSTSGIKK